MSGASTPAVVHDRKRSVQMFLCGALSASLAEAVTFPLDVCKVRGQLHNELNELRSNALLRAATATATATAHPPYHPQVLNLAIPLASTVTAPGPSASASARVSMLETAAGIIRLEGVSGLYSGLLPALIRQFVYQGINLSLYKPVRNAIDAALNTNRAYTPATATAVGTNTNSSAGSMPLYQRIAAGCISGAIGQLVASPTDVCKIRLQADGRRLLTGDVPLYPNGARDVLRSVMKNDGIRGLWKGVGPNMTRAAVVNGASIATYDHYKTSFKSLFGESVSTHVCASLMSGLMCTAVSAPIDLIKTRYINEAVFRPPLAPIKYHSPFQCLSKTVRSEGVIALWKGFVPTYARIGPYQLVFFLVYERMTKAVTGSNF